MIPELGQFALVLSAVIALFLGTVPLAGTLRHQVVWQSLARPAALLQFVLVSFSFACLASSFWGVCEPSALGAWHPSV